MFMDDRYTWMLFVTDLLYKDYGMRKTFFKNGKGSTNISKRELKYRIGEMRYL